MVRTWRASKRTLWSLRCQPFNVARAYDEAQGIDTARIWTAERDRAMWGGAAGVSNRHA